MEMKSFRKKNASYLFTVTKSKWGDTEHHYDLMHPMIQQMCKGKTYTRRSEIQQIEYQKHEDRKITYRQRQTRIGDEQTKQAHGQKSVKLGPEEEGSRRRDCTARQKHDETNKKTNGRLYKEDKEDGTTIKHKFVWITI
eukprot:15359243-Heterocapsa_arctica.AAC.1